MLKVFPLLIKRTRKLNNRVFDHPRRINKASPIKDLKNKKKVLPRKNHQNFLLKMGEVKRETKKELNKKVGKN